MINDEWILTDKGELFVEFLTASDKVYDSFDECIEQFNIWVKNNYKEIMN